jgi:pepF/M3 family oligoendopeptidase
MATKTKEKDTKLGNVPRWDLTNVYPSLESKEFQAAMKDLVAKLDEIDKLIEKHQIRKSADGPAQASADALEPVLTEMLEKGNALRRLYGTLNAYIYSFVSTDSYNKLARKLESELDQLGVRVRQQGTKFAGWVGTLGEYLPDLVKREGALADHAFFLEENHRQAKYLMSDAEEALAGELGLSGSTAWGKLQGTITSQLSVDFELDGEVQKMPMPALINVRTHPDNATRKRAFEAETAAWESVKEPLAAALNSIKGEVNTLNRKRGREDAIHSSIDTARIDRDTLDALMGAMEDSFPMFRRYFKSKAKKIGKEALAYYDLFCPVGETDRVLKFEEARDFIIDHFAGFSGELATFAKRNFDHNWIDAEMRDGKSGGGFCMSVPAVDESRILVNYDGSMDQLSTIAHELGHAYHNECQVGKTELQTITPMTLAETASIMCETIVSHAAIKAAKSDAEKLTLLESQLNNASQVVVDISSRFLFEKEVFVRRAKSELSADEISEIMLDAQRATYGDGLDPEGLHKFMWTWKPHYYSAGFSFYNYPYAFGLLFGTGLYAIYQQRGDEFIADYKDLLASTGEADAATLAARFGIDIRTKDFWKNSLDVFLDPIAQYEALEA